MIDNIENSACQLLEQLEAAIDDERRFNAASDAVGIKNETTVHNNTSLARIDAMGIPYEEILDAARQSVFDENQAQKELLLHDGYHDTWYQLGKLSCLVNNTETTVLPDLNELAQEPLITAQAEIDKLDAMVAEVLEITPESGRESIIAAYERRKHDIISKTQESKLLGLTQRIAISTALLNEIINGIEHTAVVIPIVDLPASRAEAESDEILAAQPAATKNIEETAPANKDTAGSNSRQEDTPKETIEVIIDGYPVKEVVNTILKDLIATNLFPTGDETKTTKAINAAAKASNASRNTGFSPHDFSSESFSRIEGMNQFDGIRTSLKGSSFSASDVTLRDCMLAPIFNRYKAAVTAKDEVKKVIFDHVDAAIEAYKAERAAVDKPATKRRR